MKQKIYSKTKEIVDVSKQTWMLRLCVLGLLVFAILSGLFYDLYHQELKKSLLLEQRVKSFEEKK